MGRDGAALENRLVRDVYRNDQRGRPSRLDKSFSVQRELL